MHDLEEARSTAKLVHEDLLKNVWIETIMPKEPIGAEQDWVFFLYHGVLRSNRKIFKAAGECNTGYVDKLTQS